MPDVRPVATPNPNAMMYRVDETLVPAGTFEFSQQSDKERSPLARALLQISELELVLIAPKFVTVRKDDASDWALLQPRVSATLEHFLASGDMAVLDAPDGSAPALSDVEQKIVALIDEEIRPAVAQDGGEITFVSFEDGVVNVRMSGACGSCPSSTMTLKAGIERLMTEEIPEVSAVEAVV